MTWLKTIGTRGYRTGLGLQAASRLSLEPLEDRQLLSTCHVNRLGDLGAGGTLGGFGRGDLRFCISQANASLGPDTIDFKVTGSIALNGALPDIEDELTIIGPGADLLTIDAQQKAGVFHVAQGTSVEISGLRITGGSPHTGRGGGIDNEGTLLIRDCTIAGNTVVDTPGGPRRGGGIFNQGSLQLLNSVMSDNTIPGPGLPSGGGIYNIGALNVESSIISNNFIGGAYSSIALDGGIYNDGQASIFNSRISGNKGNLVGVATVRGWGGGIYNHTEGLLFITSSFISGNEISGDYGGYGGGIANGAGSYPGGHVIVVNSTISGNLAFANGYQYGYAQGGGISNAEGGTVTVSYSTIAGNQSSGGASYTEGLGGGIGGGYYDQLPGPINLRNSIVAGNDAKSIGNDLHATLASSGYNVIENSAAGTGYAPTDILDVDPLLGALQNNGGPTLTMALLPGSPAIDVGDPNPVDPPEWDQRGPGFPRIVNERIDIGAFEVQATGAPVRPSFPDKALIKVQAFGPRNAGSTAPLETIPHQPSLEIGSPEFVVDNRAHTKPVPKASSWFVPNTLAMSSLIALDAIAFD